MFELPEMGTIDLTPVGAYGDERDVRAVMLDCDEGRALDAFERAIDGGEKADILDAGRTAAQHMHNDTEISTQLDVLEETLGVPDEILAQLAVLINKLRDLLVDEAVSHIRRERL